MLMRQFVLLGGLLTGFLVGGVTPSAQAGPLIDWLFHRPAYGPAVPVGTPYPVTTGYAPYTAGYAVAPTAPVPYTSVPYSTGYTPYGVAYPSSSYRYSTGYTPNVGYAVPNYGTYYGATAPVVGPSGYGYLSQRPVNEAITTAPAVLPPSAPVTLVPDYRSTAARVPVTYYRPVLTTDPNTGAQVVTLSPCSSYEYQTQRVPTWGLTQVYNGGATLPATVPNTPIPSPTYSLPRGGVPLAGPAVSTQPYATAYGAYPTVSSSTLAPLSSTPGSIITPATPGTIPATPYSSGYSSYASNYGNYSTMQPPPYVPPTSAYPTQPYNGTSTYYGGTSYYGGGSTGGGSTGSVLPPTSVIPYGTSGSSSLPPLSTSPSTTGAGGVYPPAGVFPPSTPSNDPAAGTIPSLPPTFNSGARLESKPQLQNIVQQPINNGRSLSSTPSNNNTKETPATNPTNEGLLPIPVPEDYDHQPRWNPGLLKEKDATAAKMPSQSDMQTAWGSKPIRWASLKSSKSTRRGDEIRAELPPAELRAKEKPVSREADINIEIPEVNFPPVQPVGAQPNNQANQGKVEPKPERAQLKMNVWQAVK